MELPSDQRAYWNQAAEEKRFTHPLDRETLSALPPSTPILDVGCGYGRLTAEVAALGFTTAVGIDTSEAMIARGRAVHPELDLRVVEPGRIPFGDETFGAVLLYSVLTCIPRNEDARALVNEIARVLRPGGLVLISDLTLQRDQRNRSRYEEAAALGATGVFTLPEGVTLRHYERATVEQLFGEFDIKHWNDLDVVTMNGNAASAFQLVARR